MRGALASCSTLGSALPSLDDELELPSEELLRLDDGTLLPPELAELRALLQLQASFVQSRNEENEEDALEHGEEPPVPGRSERLAALREQQRQHLNECLLEFDDSLLFLHSLLLEHEKLERRVRALRRRKQALPAGRCRYDEGIECGSGSDDGEGDDWRDWLTEAPRGGGGGGGGGGSSSGGGRSAAGGGGGDGDGDADDDEESLDQRLAASRQQIKACLRSLGPTTTRVGAGGGGPGHACGSPERGVAGTSFDASPPAPGSPSPSGRAPRMRRVVEGSRRALN